MSMFSSLTRSDTHAVSLLKADHRQVERLFRAFEDARDSASKVRIARDICTELTLHAQVEESLFYPAAIRALDKDGDKLVREAAVEHRSLKQLIEAIDGTGPSNTLFEANVTVLREYVEHHVREEEHELFPKLERTKLDLEALGGRMLELKQRLQKDVRGRRKPASRTRVSVPSFGPPEKSDRSVTRSAGRVVRRTVRPKRSASGTRAAKAANRRRKTTSRGRTGR